MNISFEKKRILVTGAASGIGNGIVKRLAQFGGTVIALDRNVGNLEKLVKEFPSRVIPLIVDLNEWKSAQEAVKKHFPIDLLVNCAGIPQVCPLTEVDEAAFNKVFDVNVKGTFAMTQIVVEDLLKRKIASASIVNISSQASKVALPNHTVYSASKGAIDAFTRTLALELGTKNIRVNSVIPTLVMKTFTGQHVWDDLEKRDGFLAKVPLHRFAEIDDVVDAVVFLLSEKSAMITGHSLAVDGGYLAA